MNLVWFVAKRYFTGARTGAGFLSFVKIMAVAGVAVGSASLLISLSIVHGFRSTIEDKVLGFGSHLRVTSIVNTPLYRADTLVTRLSERPDVARVQPVVEGQVIVQIGDRVEGSFFRGVVPESETTDIPLITRSGRFDLSDQSDGLPGLVMGARMARSLGAEAGSAVTVYAVSDGVIPEIRRFRVTGVYETGIDRFDDVLAIVDIRHARLLLGLQEPAAHHVEIRLRDAGQIRAVEADLDTWIGFPYLTESIYLRHANIFAWIRLQEQTVPLVIGVMIIIAAFNLIGTILMMVLERTRDIGILKAMGSTDRQVRRIFLVEGMIVGLTGLAIGIALATLFSWAQATFGIIPLNQENYYMSTAPVQPHLSDVAWVSVASLALCLGASWFPARIASGIQPLQVIHFSR
jgi:lipoprotein-releasing system permease protein